MEYSILMALKLKEALYKGLKYTEKYTNTDMVYLAKGGGWLFLSSLVSMATSFVLSIIFANFLDKNTFGIYKYVLTIFGYLGFFTLSGMGIAMVRSVAQGKEGSIYNVIWTMARWGLVGSLFSMAASIYYYANNNMLLGTCFFIAIFFLPFINVFNIYIPVLKGRKKFNTASKYEIALQFIYFIFVLFVVITWPSLPYLLLPFLITYSVFQLLLLFYFQKNNKLNQEKDDEMEKQGIHLSLVFFIGLAASSIDHLIVYYFLGPVELAIYFIALAPVHQMKGLVKIIGQLALPKLSASHETLLRYVVLKKTVLFALFLLLPIAIYIVLVPIFFDVFYPNYTESVGLSRILAISLFGSAGILSLNYFYSRNFTKKIYQWNIVTFVVKVVLMLSGIYLWGLIGVAFAYLFTQLITFIYSLYLIKYEE